MAPGAPASQATGVDGRAAWAKMKVGMSWFLAVQYNGRVMPLDSVARQIVREVTGQRTYEKYDCTALLLAWTWQWPQWADEPMVLVGNPQLQKHIGLAADRKRFTYKQLAGNDVLANLAAEAQRLSLAHQPVSPLQQGAAKVRERLSILDTIRQGTPLRIVPAMQDPLGTWVTVAEIDRQDGIDPAVRQRIRQGWDRMHEGFLAGDGTVFNGAARDLNKLMQGLKAASWPSGDRVGLEVLYNWGKPVRAGWIAMAAVMAAGLLAAAWPKRWVKWIAWMLLLDAFGLLSVGIVLRWKFSGYVPLATMYESLVFMGWGVTAIGIVTMLLVKQRGVLPIVAGTAAAILVVADAAPLDATVSLQEPVLRNTAWLTWHMLTVLLAYSALALAMGVGHVQAASLILRPQGRDWTGQLCWLLHGLMLAGSVLLAAGIIFGAAWAGASSGRYWSWDPKQISSLIALLAYMILLHGRLFRWFGSFGLAAGSILCFQLIVMIDYGASVVLGAGPRSYIFSEDGQLWVGAYVLAELVFVLGAWMLYGRAAKAQPAEMPEQVAKL